MRTSVIVAAIGLVLIGFGIAWARLERWLDERPARRRKGLEVDRDVTAYMRRRSEEIRQADADARREEQARHLKPS